MLNYALIIFLYKGFLVYYERVNAIMKREREAGKYTDFYFVFGHFRQFKKDRCWKLTLLSTSY